MLLLTQLKSSLRRFLFTRFYRDASALAISLLFLFNDGYDKPNRSIENQRKQRNESALHVELSAKNWDDHHFFVLMVGIIKRMVKFFQLKISFAILSPEQTIQIHFKRPLFNGRIFTVFVLCVELENNKKQNCLIELSTHDFQLLLKPRAILYT